MIKKFYTISVVQEDILNEIFKPLLSHRHDIKSLKKLKPVNFMHYNLTLKN